MTLQEYRRKRDFSKTKEPRAESRVPTGQRALFVVQLHHASRRHFDFRLQVGDTLKSWAVPKGPSYDPKVKRLAVEVEDHPVSYADFEGDIEHGYGKGHVDQFDKGVWATEGDAEAQLLKGHLKFELFGTRLKGSWHLVRSARKERQPSWFLIKGEDAFAGALEADDLLDEKMVQSTQRAAKKSPAGAAKKIVVGKRVVAPPSKPSHAALVKHAVTIAGVKKMPSSADFFKPELAQLRELPPPGEQWLHEVKWDGYRILATIDDSEVRLWSRNALPWNNKIPDIVQAVEALGLKSAQLDGELIAIDKQGHSDFNGLQQTLSGEALWPLVYVLFDMPYFEGYDLTRAALVDRKSLLEKLLQKPPRHLSFSTHSIGNGEAAFAMACEQRIEGIISKRADSGYRAGRGDDWLKIKRLESDEFAVIGYTPPKGGRTGFGSLLLARPDPDDKKGWIYAGRVGSGFNDEQLQTLSATLASKGAPKPSVPLRAIDPTLRGALWVRPTAVAEVFYRGIGNKTLLRQPSLKTLRLDKSAADLRDADRPLKSAAAAPKESVRAAAGKAAPSKRTDAISEIKITHPDRVVYPDMGITKQDVAHYYQAVMDWFLPGVIDRPTSVIRCPDGAGKNCFFQKHLMQGLHHVGSARLKEESGAAAVYIYPQSAASIIELVQFGVLEFHPWGSTIEKPDQANRIVFDLDPGPNVPWERVVAAARLVKQMLEKLGLETFLRTTGGKGLHVVVPLNPGCPWPMVKRFAHAFADTLAAAHPLEFVATASKAQRGGKIYIDYLRNGRGATSVASYSLRSREGAPVAVPLRWSELGKLKSGHQFNLATTLERIKRLRRDPWDGVDTVKQNLDKVISLLQGDDS